MNFKRGLFRLWFVLSTCWICGNFYLWADELQALYSPSRAALEARDLKKWHQDMHDKGCTTSGPMATCNGRLSQIYLGRTDWPIFTDLEPDWAARRATLIKLLPQLLGPPLAILGVGLVFLWVGQGFRRGAQANQPRHRNGSGPT